MGLLASGLCSAAMLTHTAAPACPMAKRSAYIGGGVNYLAVLTDKREKTIEQTLKVRKIDDHKVGFNVFVGEKLTKHWGHELGFNYINKFKYTNKEGEADATDKQSVEDMYHVYYDGYAYLPITSWFEMYAKGGLSYLHMKQIDHNDPDETHTLNTFALNGGVGVQFMYQQFALRANYTRIVPTEWTRTDSVRDDYLIPDFVSVEALYHFT
jgi:opacity protein-like surface antigen